MKGDTLVLPAARARVSDLVTLAKPRLNLLVVLTTLVGFFVASPRLDIVVLANVLIGTALVAAAASTLNQVLERDIDGRMRRTRLRPLPDGRLQPGEAIVFGGLLASTGLLMLAVGTNGRAALVALVTLVSYVAVYTPLKPRTPLSTLVGAVPGALPPVIGWAAARGDLSWPAWTLFAIVFVWQMPHFLAIAWIYRDEYANAGIPLLPVVDPAGGRTARQVLGYAAALVPVSLTPYLAGIAGTTYAAGAVLLGVTLLGIGWRFARDRQVVHARRLFVGSIVYLPALLLLLVLDRVAW